MRRLFHECRIIEGNKGRYEAELQRRQSARSEVDAVHLTHHDPASAPVTAIHRFRICLR
jgi:hypothetical protein